MLLRALLRWVRDAVGLFTGDQMQVQEIGGTRSLASAGDDSEDILGLENSAANQVLLGNR